MELKSQLTFHPLVMVRAPRLNYASARRAVKIDDLLTNEIFLNAVRVANPGIFTQIEAYTAGRLTERKKIERLKSTLFNYLSRMSVNSTPLGLFASVGVSEWGDALSQPTLNGYRIVAKLDTALLEILMTTIRLHPDFRSEFIYEPNNTVYKVGNRLRYIEALLENDVTSFNIASADSNEVIDEILEFTTGGKSVRDIATHLGKLYQYSYDELQDFLFELVEAQILNSRFSFNIAGTDPLKQLVHQFNNLGLVSEQYSIFKRRLEAIDHILNQVNANQIRVEDAELELSAIFSIMGIPQNGKQLLRTDLYSHLTDAVIPSKFQQNLLEAVDILGMFKPDFSIPRLEEFKRKFVDRYEDAAVPLLQVLDSDLGISFGNFKFGSENVFYDERHATTNEETSAVPILTKPFQILQDKIIAARKSGVAIVELSPGDFDGLRSGASKLAATYQIFFNVLDTGNPLLYLDVAGNVSGGCLWSRFSMESPEIELLMRSVAEAEQEYYKGAVVAEIVHIPEHRLGNLILRTHFRAYELPLLNLSSLEPSKQIKADDLWVTVKGRRIILWSKTLNKEIIPRNTTVHNYNLRSTPLYQFLCELQYQDTIPSVSLDASDLPEKSLFTPRVQYKNVILSFASWRITADMIGQYHIGGPNQADAIDAFLSTLGIPGYCTYIDNNQITFLNWSDSDSVNLFLKYIRINKQALLRENPFSEINSLIVDESSAPYISKCVAVVFNKNKQPFTALQPVRMAMVHEPSFKSRHSIGDEWLYFKLYCGKYIAEKLLTEVLWPFINDLRTDHVIDQFFYLQYNDPDYHLRFRLRHREHQSGDIISQMRRRINEYLEDGRVWKFQIDTYNREVGRYGIDLIESCEKIFELDSELQLKTLSIEASDLKDKQPLLFIRSVIALFDGLQLDQAERYQTIASLKEGYEAEFNVGNNKNLQKYLNATELRLRKPIVDFADGTKEFASNGQALARFLLLALEFEKKVSALSLELTFHQQKDRILSVLPSLVHMQAIRRFKNNPRQNELFCYYALHAYYKKLTYTYATTTIRNP